MATTATDKTDRPAWTDLREGPVTRPLWPDIGRALGLGRSATYAAAARGDIPTWRIGHKLLCPVPRLLEMLGDQGAE